MKEIYVSGTTKEIWKQLDTEYVKFKNTFDEIQINLNFDGITQFPNISLLEQYRSEAIKKINIQINYVLNQYTNRWIGFVLREIKQINGYSSGLSDGILKKINKIDVSFKVDSQVNISDIDDLLKKVFKTAVENSELYNVDSKINIDDKFIHDSTIHIKQNNRQGWLDTYATIKQMLKTYQEYEIKISYLRMTVILNNENDVTNVRHFFPLWHHFKNYFEITLVVLSDDEKSGYGALKFFSILKQYLNINIIKNGEPLEDLKVTRASDILPMLSLDSNSNNKYEIDLLIDDIFLYLKNPNNYNGVDGKFKIPLKPDEKNEIYSKAQIKEKLLSKIEDLIDQSNRFEKLIFLFLIRHLLREKDIFTYEQGSKKTTKVRFDLNYNLLDLTFLNAKNYAEGLLQIIENAQMHSEGHVAYFGMRLYNADSSVSMSEITKEANTREVLWRRYWYNKGKVRKEITGINSNKESSIFNCGINDGYDRYPNFIEFYVLDDAVASDCSALGIVNKINNTESLNTEIWSIEKIFKLTENDYKNVIDDKVELPYKLMFYVQHYGMRWFKQHINNLHGMMEIYSPFFGVDDDNKARAYSNIFENLEKVSKIEFKNLYSTEYSILIPLKYNQ